MVSSRDFVGFTRPARLTGYTTLWLYYPLVSGFNRLENGHLLMVNISNG